MSKSYLTTIEYIGKGETRKEILTPFYRSYIIIAPHVVHDHIVRAYTVAFVETVYASSDPRRTQNHALLTTVFLTNKSLRTRKLRLKMPNKAKKNKRNIFSQIRIFA